MGNHAFGGAGVPNPLEGLSKRLDLHPLPKLLRRISRRFLMTNKHQIGGLSGPGFHVREHGAERGINQPDRTRIHVIALDPLSKNSARGQPVLYGLVELAGVQARHSRPVRI